MRHISKGDTPAALINAQDNRWTWEEFSKLDHIGHSAVIQQSVREQGDVCAYTELPLQEKPNDVHLDHFKRKGLPAYTGLRFNWGNVLAALHSKGREYGADHKDSLVNEENHLEFYSMLINPVIEDPQSFFQYMTDGRIMPRYDISEDNKERALFTIEVFKLNHGYLCNRRRGIMSLVNDYSDLSGDVVRECCHDFGFPSVVDFVLSKKES